MSLPPRTSFDLDLLENVHPGLSELKSRIGEYWEDHEDKERSPDSPFQRSSGLHGHDRRKDGIECVEHRRDTKSNEDFPRRQNIATGDLDLGGSKSLWIVGAQP